MRAQQSRWASSSTAATARHGDINGTVKAAFLTLAASSTREKRHRHWQSPECPAKRHTGASLAIQTKVWRWSRRERRSLLVRFVNTVAETGARVRLLIIWRPTTQIWKPESQTVCACLHTFSRRAPLSRSVTAMGNDSSVSFCECNTFRWLGWDSQSAWAGSWNCTKLVLTFSAASLCCV